MPSLFVMNVYLWNFEKTILRHCKASGVIFFNEKGCQWKFSNFHYESAYIVRCPEKQFQMRHTVYDNCYEGPN